MLFLKLEQKNEFGLVREKISAAINLLKSSNLGLKYRGSASLYALPWYLIIGSSASGKSTLMRHSGLHFSLTKKDELAVQGLAATRDCDWWFSDRAIILDTAGRYTTEETDQNEWFEFLRLLRKSRPQLPINGILVAINLAELLISAQDEMNWQVKIIRDRIDEIYQRLGIVIPVHVIFTKCDLLKGFEIFFQDLDETQRQKAWGLDLTFGESSEHKLNIFCQKLSTLYDQLKNSRLRKLIQERILAKKIAIYDFPEQFRCAKQKIIKFFQLLLKNNPYQKIPEICGVYFSSGAQEGQLIKRLMDNAQGMFGHVEESMANDLCKQSDLSRNYFINNIFTRIIIRNDPSIMVNHRKLSWRRKIKNFAIVGAALIVLSFFSLYSTAFTYNTQLLNHGVNYIKQLSGNFNLYAVWQSLSYYDHLRNYSHIVPWYFHLGLSERDPQVSLLERMLVQVMTRKMFYPAMIHLEKELQSFNRAWQLEKNRQTLRGPYYRALKAYLMISDPDFFELNSAVNFFTTASIDLPEGKTILTRRQMMALWQFYLMHLTNHNSVQIKPWHSNNVLLAQAKHDLQSGTYAENLYAEIKDQTQRQIGTLPFAYWVHGYGDTLLRSNFQMPQIFTIQGWKTVFQPLLDQAVQNAKLIDWVTTPLQNSQAIIRLDNQRQQELRADIVALYEREYLKLWLSWLSAISFTHFQSLQDASKQMLILANKEGPIAQIFSIISSQLTILGKPKFINEKLASNIFELQQWIKPDVNAVMSVSIKMYLNALLAVQNDIQRLAASYQYNHDAQQYASRIMLGSGVDLGLYRGREIIYNLLGQLNSTDARQTMMGLLLQPLRESWRAVLTAADQDLQEQWERQVYLEYQQTIANKFPFMRASIADASLSDVENFLHPKNGIFWKFINIALSPYIFLDTDGWHEQTWLDVTPQFSKNFLQQLHYSKKITDGLFNGNLEHLNFIYEVFPEPTPRVSQIILTVNGQAYRYTNGPQQWETRQWSSQSEEQSSQLTAIAARGISPETLHEQGLWSLFHLLCRGHYVENMDGIYHFTWQLKGRQSYPIRMGFRISSEKNIFSTLLSNEFILPQKIFNNY